MYNGFPTLHKKPIVSISPSAVLTGYDHPVVERSKELIPKLLSERRKVNKATLVRDKLYVNNKFVE